MMVSPQENRKFEKDNEWITIGFRLVEAKVKQEFPTPRPIGTALKGTSQGGKYDKPPDDWIRSELVEFGVLGQSVNVFLLQTPSAVMQILPLDLYPVESGPLKVTSPTHRRHL